MAILNIVAGITLLIVNPSDPAVGLFLGAFFNASIAAVIGLFLEDGDS